MGGGGRAALRAGEGAEEVGPRDSEFSPPLRRYYRKRAPEYERIYHRDDPTRRAELAAIAEVLRKLLSDRRVLEIACGTGFWTQIAAQVASHIVAIDTSPEMLTIARRKELPPDKVQFHIGDAYSPETIPSDFDAGMANFWLSHVPKSRLGEFLRRFHNKLGSGSVVFMADNVYMPGCGGELTQRSGSADTFKLRTLQDGSRFEVLKNYYDEEELHRILDRYATNPTIYMGECYWWVGYKVPCNK